MVPDMELDELEELIHHYDHHAQLPSHDHDTDDCVAVGEHSPIPAGNDHIMVLDLDLEELHLIIGQKNKERANEFGKGKSERLA